MDGKIKINKNGYLYFHQGWADIINQLALINYYSKRYDKIILIIREDSKSLIDFYIKSLPNVEPLYIKKDTNIPQSVFDDPNGEILFHGIHDRYRKNFVKTCTDINPEHFWKNFYICYGVDYNVRVEDFAIDRDYGLEDIKYNEFIEKHGKNYILYHEDVISPIARQMVIDKSNENYKYVSLTNTTDVFFDYIKILENAKEIHVVDSVWATIIYHLDAKYNLFKNIPIKVSCLRNHNYMFIEPIKLDNWEII